MIDIVVTTGLGDLRGLDIINPMFTNVDLMVARGTNELDLQSNRWVTTTITTPYKPNTYVGDVCKVVDTFNNIVGYGKITGVAVQLDKVSVIHTLTLEILI